MKDLWTINVAVAVFSGYIASITPVRSVFWVNAAAVLINVLAVVFHFAL
jgi:hypothetical protein